MKIFSGPINTHSDEVEKKGCLLTKEEGNGFFLRLSISLAELSLNIETFRIILLNPELADDLVQKLTSLEQDFESLVKERKPLLSEYHNRSCCSIIVSTR